ncbi:sigma-70 family RNA polymerase sigma factor [Tepidibacter aestuarii]|uniref:sigma-70 family RNA polymerase sigma factor n=1 Tax=Tepidibacter aestuarii TaxID=2925782 RepID=UPI0020BF283B|nr:sigma-70 family RNA polymerase sigma factor [Tepidibacter aestuarii]CAH2215058.1 RNA polymerase sigma factor RpoH [Tepidibacter aestuarii]
MNAYEEINELVKKSQNGDKDSLEKLLDTLKPLLISKCKHYFGYINEDLYQNGVIKSIELIQNFDFKKNTKFLGYMKFMISCFYWDQKKDELNSKEVSVNFDDNQSKDVYIEDFSNIETIEALSILNATEIKIVEKNLIQGHTLLEISKEMGISYSWVKRVKSQSVKKLEKYYSLNYSI